MACLCLVVVCRWSFLWSLLWPCRALVYRGCPCRDPPVCHRVQGDSVAKRIPWLCVLIGVVTSCVLCARVRGRASRSCATENTYTPARLEALFKLSVVTILSPSYRLLQHFCGLWVLCSTRHLVRHVLELVEISSEISCLLSAVSQSILFTQVQICFSLGRLINFECCRVCLRISSRREIRCTSCQRCG